MDVPTVKDNRYEQYQIESSRILTQTLRSFFHDKTLVFDRSRFAGGLTNYNYVMNVHGEEYIVRQPGPLTDVMIDREIEEFNTGIVADFSINSDCVFFDANTGIKISRFIPNSLNLAKANPTSSKNLKAVSDLMKKVHTMPRKFGNIFCWQEELEKYEEVVKMVNGVFFFDYIPLKQKAFAFCEENIRNVELVPCHNDTVPENFLLGNKEDYYLIDWEYSGLNDLNFDLAAFIVETRLTKTAINELLHNYYGEKIPEDAVQKIKAYILVQDLLWTVWAIIRHYSGENFADYCEMRYDRFRRNVLELTKNKDFPLDEMVEIVK
ncbi:choline kinase [Enterococcus gilvus]|jgi:thiamine kinase-like enzyme|uniref:choline kinase family protein n=1 Tax=Enterococcus gilvus TaxID=160453 RepID=UPI000DF63697|nr:choline kinase family protein [Enterococcus gilvus]AXG38045.1 choline kinase [Enterococcus gilvus]